MINIPLAQYTHYVQPLLQLLYPVEEQKVGADGQPIQNVESTVPWSNQHPFLNISITPIECSVVCSRSLARKYFEPVVSHMSHLKMQDRVQASISKEDFVVVSVEGEGLEASQRVLELTTPLAMAGMYVILSFPQTKNKRKTVNFACTDPFQFHFFHHDLLFRLYSRALKISRSSDSSA